MEQLDIYRLEKYLENNPEQKGFFVETAHPVKFYDVVEPLIGRENSFTCIGCGNNG